MRISEELHCVWGSAGLTGSEKWTTQTPSVPGATGTFVNLVSNVP